MERTALERRLACSFVGTGNAIRDGIDQFVRVTQADELIVTAQIFDHAARLRSYEILADTWIRGGSH
jgi:alkanesulfonate monooxygenase SsuD/methylene tetrahydromethanopterin reductase-like flavin-dependent oxidoreductase (luciferase family)